MSMNLSEQVAALTALVVKLHRRDGMAQQLRSAAFGSRDSMSKVAKLCGVSAEVVGAWERGALEPTPTEALRWLTVLHGHDHYGVRPKPGTYEAAQATADDAGEAGA